MLVDAALSIGKTCRTESMVVGKGIKLLPSLKDAVTEVSETSVAVVVVFPLALSMSV